MERSARLLHNGIAPRPLAGLTRDDWLHCLVDSRPLEVTAMLASLCVPDLGEREVAVAVPVRPESGAPGIPSSG